MPHPPPPQPEMDGDFSSPCPSPPSPGPQGLPESPSPPAARGRWVMFFEDQDLDAAWLLARGALARGDLPGIESIEVHAAGEPSRQSFVVFLSRLLPSEGACVAVGGRIADAMAEAKKIETEESIYWR